MKCISLTVLLLLTPSLSAQSITVPDTVQVPAPGLVTIRPSAIDADDVLWTSLDGGLQLIDSDLLAKKEVAVGFCSQAGVYRLQVIVAKDVKGKAALSTPQIVTVTVGMPPPPPPPPGPTDPLAAALQAAYASDPDPQKAAMVPLLVKTLTYGAGAVSSNPTVGALNAAMLGYGKSAGIQPTNIATVQAVVSTELMKFLPDPNATPSATYNATVAAQQFNRIAGMLNQLKLGKK